MSEPMPLTRMEMPERRMLPVVTVGPYVLLALLTVATVAIKHSAVGSLRIDLILCGLAAAWIAWMFTLHPAWRVRPRPMAVFFVVFVVIMAILVIRDPWFGFLTPAGYFYAFAVLRWPWRLAGVAAVAVVAATAQASGINKGHRPGPGGLFRCGGRQRAANVLADLARPVQRPAKGPA